MGLGRLAGGQALAEVGAETAEFGNPGNDAALFVGRGEWHWDGPKVSKAEPNAQRLALSGARFDGAVFWRARFWHANLDHARFEGAALVQAEFLHCSLQGTDWVGAEMGGTQVRPPVGDQPGQTATSPVGAKLELANGHAHLLTACAFSPDGRWVLSASSDKTLRLWDAASGALLRNHLHAVGSSAA